MPVIGELVLVNPFCGCDGMPKAVVCGPRVQSSRCVKIIPGRRRLLYVIRFARSMALKHIASMFGNGQTRHCQLDFQRHLPKQNKFY